MRENTCCFTGHRQLSASTMGLLLGRLNDEIDALIQKGVTTFLSGGAMGFDQLAAAQVLKKREEGYAVRLVMVLPSREQSAWWPPKARQRYETLLAQADEVFYVADAYTEQCLKDRNYHMVDHSAYCICALRHSHSGTGQTVRYAKEKNLLIINVA